MLKVLAIHNYRSLRSAVLPLADLNVVSGENGTGKSNLYRALRLLATTAQGGIVSSLAREGGLSSTLWAGPEQISRAMKSGEHKIEGTRRKEVVSLKLGFTGDDFNYAIDLGLPTPSSSAFGNDPEIKRECIWQGAKLRPSAVIVDRRGAVVQSRNKDGEMQVITSRLSVFDSMLTEVSDPARAPEILAMREQIRTWRFYDHFRSDVDSPIRKAQLATRTPVLSADGHDVAAAMQTIREIGDGQALDKAVEDAFPGCKLLVTHHDTGFSLALDQHGLLRPLTAAELSDGTLRYLLWIAALLTPRPPTLMVLNEPETSLHPDLLPALGRLMLAASKHSQLWVVTHSQRLLSALQEDERCNSIHLVKEFGETHVAEQGLLAKPAWQWPER